MSVRASAWVWQASEASGSALLVLLKLADECDDRGETWQRGIKLATIAEACRISIRQARRCCQELEDLGELRRIDQPGRGRPSRYLLTAYRRREGIVDDGEKEDAGDRLREDEKADAGDRVRSDKAAEADRLSRGTKADADGRLSAEKADTGDTVRRTPVTGPIDVPSTVPTTTESPPPTLPPGDSGAAAPRELTPQQRAVARVQSVFQHHDLPPPDAKRIVGLIRNAGGFDAVDEVLMPVLRRLANREELSEESAFAAVATATRNRGRRSRGPASRRGSRPATLDDARRQRLEEIASASRAAG